jgi:hypothetical protein
VKNQQTLTSHEAFARLDRARLADLPRDEALAEIAEVTRRAVPGAEDVSVTLLGAAGAHTAAFTGKTALDLDEWQYDHGHGPCLAAAAANITVHVPDTAADRRWPVWADRAVDAGTHSSLSVGLPLLNSVSGALNLYAAEPEAFGDDDVLLAQTFAGYAAVAISQAPAPSDSREPATPWASLPDHQVVEQARGIIMAERHCAAQEALAILKYMAAQGRRPVPEVAAAVVAGLGREPGVTPDRRG